MEEEDRTSRSFGPLSYTLEDPRLMKEAAFTGAVGRGFRDASAAPSETSPSSSSTFMVPLILKEQQLDRFSQERTEALQQETPQA